MNPGFNINGQIIDKVKLEPKEEVCFYSGTE